MTDFTAVMHALHDDGVRFVVVGVWGANLYAGNALFLTRDQELFLPFDPQNLLRAWRCCERLGLDLLRDEEPLHHPRGAELAAATVRTRSPTHATDHGPLHLDLSLVMGAFEFPDVAARRRVFVVDGAPTPVASLDDIVAAKQVANRPADRLFVASHAHELRRLVGD